MVWLWTLDVQQNYYSFGKQSLLASSFLQWCIVIWHQCTGNTPQNSIVAGRKHRSSENVKIQFILLTTSHLSLFFSPLYSWRGVWTGDRRDWLTPGRSWWSLGLITATGLWIQRLPTMRHKRRWASTLMTVYCIRADFDDTLMRLCMSCVLGGG